jgi:hypothetical protein
MTDQDIEDIRRLTRFARDKYDPFALRSHCGQCTVRRRPEKTSHSEMSRSAEKLGEFDQNINLPRRSVGRVRTPTCIVRLKAESKVTGDAGVAPRRLGQASQHVDTGFATGHGEPACNRRSVGNAWEICSTAEGAGRFFNVLTAVVMQTVSRPPSRVRRYGGHPSRGLPPEAHARKVSVLARQP